MYRIRPPFTGIVALGLACSLLAAPAPFQSGPKVGDNLPGPFRPYLVSGKDKHKGKFHCLVSENALNPVLMLLVQGTEPSDTLLGLLKQVEALVEKNQDTRLAAFVVFLDPTVKDLLGEDDLRDMLAAKLEEKTSGLKLVAVGLEGFAAIKDLYKLHDDAEITAVIYNKLKVLSSHVFPKDGLKEDGVQVILEDLKARLKGFREEALGKRAS